MKLHIFMCIISKKLRGKMKKQGLRIISIVFIILISVTIFGFSAQNGESSGSLSKSIIIKIADILNVNKNRTKFEDIGEKIIRKLAHFTIYAFLGICIATFITTFKMKEKLQVICSIIWSFLYAGTDEIHQLFSPGRHGSFGDVLLDTIGAGVGICIVFIIIYIAKMRNNKLKEQ